MAAEWGPLAPLAGSWEGDAGYDTAYSHARGELVLTPYREKASLTPFGPVDNGRQRLYGLDYRTAMWRGADVDPFHTEVGYWLWDAASGEVVRAFVIPRGVTVLAGGTAVADADEFSLAADLGDSTYAIGENQYLAKRASSLSYRVTVVAHADGTWSYEQVSTLKLSELADPLAHTDRNTLRRVT